MKPAGNYKEIVTNLALPQGVYFIRLVAGNATVVAKAVFLK
jgi:hypothetical protein